MQKVASCLGRLANHFLNDAPMQSCGFHFVDGSADSFLWPKLMRQNLARDRVTSEKFVTLNSFLFGKDVQDTQCIAHDISDVLTSSRHTVVETLTIRQGQRHIHDCTALGDLARRENDFRRNQGELLNVLVYCTSLPSKTFHRNLHTPHLRLAKPYNG